MVLTKRGFLWLLVAAMSILMLMLAFNLTLVLLGVVVLLGSFVYLVIQLESSRHHVSELDRLKSAYEQLDQQAKLIIRTDFELHRTQEELDRRLSSLMSLHQLGKQLQVSLRPEEIFSKLDSNIVSTFGFSKGLLGSCTSFESIEWRSVIGVDEHHAEEIRLFLVKNGLLKHVLTNPLPRTIHSASATDNIQRELLALLGLPVAVVVGIVPNSGPAGFLLLGRPRGNDTDSKVEEELVAILANQLAIAVENSALYEETWASQRALEEKVKERTSELAKANMELTILNKSKSDFVSAVSHELRTPLAAIKGYAALLRSGQFGSISEPQAERITKIEKHADLLTQLINNLLDIARIESGRVVMERSPIPAEEFFANVHDMVQPQLEAKHLRYTIEFDSVRELFGDQQHLQRVFVNLLSNAIKYTPERGLIKVGLKQEKTLNHISVSDTGCGISPNDIAKLFQEFYRADDQINKQIRGTGLGLALAKRIVEAHEGNISVVSTPQKGSTFTVSLPV